MEDREISYYLSYYRHQLAPTLSGSRISRFLTALTHETDRLQSNPVKIMKLHDAFRVATSGVARKTCDGVTEEASRRIILRAARNGELVEMKVTTVLLCTVENYLDRSPI